MSENAGELRFVLMRHEMPDSSARGSHYDLMLERRNDLFTLELREELLPDVSQTARELAPHRKAYLDYEGPVSRDRGYVRAVDRGVLNILTWDEETIAADFLGDSLQGRLKLTRERDSALWVVEFRAF